jgi:RNA polymerase sigma-70 factor (ECF subfamily)
MDHCVPDSELLERVCRGDDTEAFAEIVRRYEGRLIAFLIRLTKSRELAEDIAQEILFRLYLRASRYRNLKSREGLIPLLARMAMNFASNVRDHENCWKEMAIVLQAESDVDPSEPGLEAMANEARSKVTEALAKVQEKYRIPLTLFELENWTYDQIARARAISIGTVKSRIARGRAELRRLLSGFWNGGIK